MSTPKLRVGLIGAGGISHVHVQGWAKLNPDCAIVAIADPVEANRKRRGDEAKVASDHLFDDFNKMLKSAKLDAVDICTPNSFHAPAAIAALEAGCHVLCEKPLAATPDDIRKMIAVRDKSKKTLMTAQHMRFENRSRALKAYLDTGVMGDIYYARSHFLRRRFIPTPAGFIDKSLSGGGPTIDIGVHILDLTLHLMGQPEPVSVTGITPLKLGKRTDIRGHWGEWDRERMSVEDFAAGFVRFSNGAALSLECSWLANIREPEVTKITLIGTESGAEWPDLMVFSEKAGNLTDTKLAFVDTGLGGHAQEIAAFADAVLNSKPSPVPSEQSLKVQRILDGLYRSHESGGEVKF
jgi:predicted dehydrogenase